MHYKNLLNLTTNGTSQNGQLREVVNLGILITNETVTELIFETRKNGQLSEVVSLGGSTVYSVLIRIYSANHNIIKIIIITNI